MKIEVEPEDRNAVTGPVRIGIGTAQQSGALYTAGAERLCPDHWVRRTMSEDEQLISVAFRAEDTVIMVQPNLLSLSELKFLTSIVANFHVPECGDFKLNTDKAIKLFRQLKPKLDGVERVENRGGRVKYPQPTQLQMDRMVGWWRDTSLKRDQVVDNVSDMLGEPVPAHWIRDQVKKETGSVARDACAPSKKPLPPLKDTPDLPQSEWHKLTKSHRAALLLLSTSFEVKEPGSMKTALHDLWRFGFAERKLNPLRYKITQLGQKAFVETQ